MSPTYLSYLSSKNQGRIEQQGSIYDFLNEETDGYLKQEGSENYLLDPVEVEFELYIVQQVNVAYL